MHMKGEPMAGKENREIKKLDKDDKKNVILYTQLHLIISCLEEVELSLDNSFIDTIISLML